QDGRAEIEMHHVEVEGGSRQQRPAAEFAADGRGRICPQYLVAWIAIVAALKADGPAVRPDGPLASRELSGIAANQHRTVQDTQGTSHDFRAPRGYPRLPCIVMP